MHVVLAAVLQGYFQLKANPGAWELRLRAGRSEEIYQISSHDGTDSPSDASDIVVVMDTFKSKIIKVRVGTASDILGTEDRCTCVCMYMYTYMIVLHVFS